MGFANSSIAMRTPCSSISRRVDSRPTGSLPSAVASLSCPWRSLCGRSSFVRQSSVVVVPVRSFVFCFVSFRVISWTRFGGKTGPIHEMTLNTNTDTDYRPIAATAE